MLVFYINWDRALAKGKSTHCLLPHFHCSGLRGHGCGCSAQFDTLKFSGTRCFYFYKLALLFGREKQGFIRRFRDITIAATRAVSNLPLASRSRIGRVDISG